MEKCLQAFIITLNKKDYDFDGKLRNNFSREIYYAYTKRHLYNILKELDLYDKLVSKKNIKIVYP